ncbi:MAG TPA: GMC family oxidoreductase N-terminal domain-containing protein [Ktedonobacterales bacterium]|jgi:choline dehydrogenase
MHDYIIIGAGSAGCALANRLTEDPQTSVLLLEAGGPDRAAAIRIPVAASTLYKGPYDWALETEPQPHLNGRRLYFGRGKGLGGSGLINSMIAIRGAAADYDEWAALGNAGWSYADVLPYFKKLEHDERGASPYHGTAGPLNVAAPRYLHPLTRAFLAAAVAHGYARNPDLNGATQEGVAPYLVTQRGGRRHSPAAAYLRPVAGRRNLTILTGARAAALLLEGDRVTGVRYRRDGRAYEALAARETLLCCGAIHSPQVLLLSGIGPAEHLRALGIPVARDLPGVGQQLRDHLAMGVIHGATRPSLEAAIRSWRLPGNLLRYALRHRGPLTSIVVEAGGFVKSSADLPAPDLQLNFIPAFALDHGFTRARGHHFSIGVLHLRPQSCGSVSLRSPDPLDPPRLQPNYLAHPDDAAALLHGVALVRAIAATPPLAALSRREVYPGARVQDPAELLEWTRAYAMNGDHPVGTLRMGRDALAVVDERLRVHGLRGLRVVDASVMPTIPRGNTNLPTIMIAERAADLIKADNR